MGQKRKEYPEHVLRFMHEHRRTSRWLVSIRKTAAAAIAEKRFGLSAKDFEHS